MSVGDSVEVTDPWQELQSVASVLQEAREDLDLLENIIANTSGEVDEKVVQAETDKIETVKKKVSLAISKVQVLLERSDKLNLDTSIHNTKFLPKVEYNSVTKNDTSDVKLEDTHIIAETDNSHLITETVNGIKVEFEDVPTPGGLLNHTFDASEVYTETDKTINKIFQETQVNGGPEGQVPSEFFPHLKEKVKRQAATRKEDGIKKEEGQENFDENYVDDGDAEEDDEEDMDDDDNDPSFDPKVGPANNFDEDIDFEPPVDEKPRKKRGPKKKLDDNGKRRRECILCQSTFANHQTIVKHIKEEHGPGPFDCVECDQSLENYLKLKQHLKYHNKNRGADKSRRNTQLLTCELCPKQMCWDGLRKHFMNVHGDRYTQECSKCPMKFIHLSRLEHHIKMKHRTPLRCETCGKEFCRKSRLKAHIRVHTGEKPNVCYICGKSFFQKGHLNFHIQTIHEGTKQQPKLKELICGKCGKSCKGAQSLKNHEKTHNEIREVFKCEICFKPFKHYPNLCRHVRVIHKGVKAYSCEICHRTFASNTHVKQHMPVHKDVLDIKPHQCQDCDKTFAHIRSLKEHRLKHHK